MGKKILVVDDEKEITEELGAFLAENDYEVTTANDGAEGFRKAKTEKPDLIILDVLMPKMSGYDMVKSLRSEIGEESEIPVIVISARPSMKEFFSGSEIRNFLSKPFQLGELLSSVAAALNNIPDPVPGPAQQQAFRSDPPVQCADKRVMIIGVEEYLLDKLKDRLESLDMFVYRAVDEEEVIQQTAEVRPDLVLCQFWEDANILDAARLCQSLQKGSATSSIPFAAFCRDNISLDALKALGRSRVITFLSTEDLTQKLESFLKKCF